MGGVLVQFGTVLSTFVSVALVVFGGYSAYWGTVSLEQSVAFGLFAVVVVAGYRSFAVRREHWVDATGTTMLVLAGAGAYALGVTVGPESLQAVGHALFALGCVHYVLRGL